MLLGVERGADRLATGRKADSPLPLTISTPRLLRLARDLLPAPRQAPTLRTCAPYIIHHQSEEQAAASRENLDSVACGVWMLPYGGISPHGELRFTRQE